MTNSSAPPPATVRAVRAPRSPVPADRGTRLGATMLDGLIFAAMVYLPLLVGVVVAGAAGSATNRRTVGPVFAMGGLLTLIGLIAWCWLTISFVKRNGQSIAKRVLGIKVVRADGAPVSLGRVFWLRNFLNALVSIIPPYGLVDALFIFGESRQCLHDKLADTVVVKA
jgi:uncharacterized RDD family membrane protein YckC